MHRRDRGAERSVPRRPRDNGQSLLIQCPAQDRLTNVTTDVVWH
jgi:hypothetical protein